jgi:transcriptional regulator with XRE-family HTH domain
MDCKFRRLWKKLVEVSDKWVLELYTLFCTHLKRKDLLNPAGERKVGKTEEVRGGAITNSQVVGLRPWKRFCLSVQIYLAGNQFRGMANVEEDNGRSVYINISSNPKEILEHLGYSFETISKVLKDIESDEEKKQKLLTALKVYRTTLEIEKEALEILENTSKLEKRLRKYKEFDPAETWSSRWIASPIVYLFPEERREEWLGDLYEINREMIRKNYPRWMVNINNVVRTSILVVSAMQVKFSDFTSFFSRRVGK